MEAEMLDVGRPDDDVSVAASTGTALSHATEELFWIWKTNCMELTTTLTSVDSSNPRPQTQKVASVLQAEARRFFASLLAGTSVRIDTDGSTTTATTVLQTQASHGEALALLIQCLGPCFSATASRGTRWAALSCLVGSIEGCQPSSPPATVASASTMSLTLTRLLSTFLLEHTRPINGVDAIDHHENAMVEDDDCEEQIRDTALTGLCFLLHCCHEPEKSNGSSNDDSAQQHQSFIKLFMHIAQAGVEGRCTPRSDDNTEDNDDTYGYSRQATTASGLSLLPRSRRSLCFDLVRAAVDVTLSQTKHWNAPMDGLEIDTVRRESVSFCQFSASLLHGESDPRCLLQLLQLFDCVQTSFQYLGLHFPISEYFDAVAPYYPIQFNPPPNDTHGITRSPLRCAVLRVLSCTFHDKQHTDEDNMLSLTHNLILETLVPPPEDEPATLQEQYDALEDLQSFLFATPGPTPDANCQKLDETEMKNLSRVMLSVHEKSSLAVARGETVALTKELADLCRAAVARIAYSLERSSNEQLWCVFVEQPAKDLSTRLDSSQSGRVALAFLACLSASGGVKTVQVSLKAGLVPLLRCITDSLDGSELASSFYGVGAFFSSCRVAMERAANEGLHLDPHPLQVYCNDATAHICLALTTEATNATRFTVQAAAIRALESVVTSSPIDCMSNDSIEHVIMVCRMIASKLLEAGVSDFRGHGGIHEESDFLDACTLTFGTCLGFTLDLKIGGNNTQLQPSALASSQLNSFFLDDFLPALLASVKIKLVSGAMPLRRDKTMLAVATSYSLSAARQIVLPLVEELQFNLLKRTNTNASLRVAETLSFLFELHNGYAAKAYHEMSSPKVTAFDIIMAIVPENERGNEEDFGTSILQLPKTPEDRQKSDDILMGAYEIIDLLRNSYEVNVASQHFIQLVSFVSQLLPPLSDVDAIRLSMAVPFLSAALESKDSSLACTGDEKVACEQLRGMIRDLADFSMANDFFPAARVHSARCLHAIISKLTPRNAQECPSRDLVRDILLPTLKSTKVAPLQFQFVKDRLSLIALLGSAAAQRGGPSSKTSDQIILFLIDLACTTTATMTFQDVSHEPIDFNSRELDGSSRLSIHAASACGSILSTGLDQILCHQRLVHIAFKRINECAYAARLQDEKASLKMISIGFITAMCHIICSGSLENVNGKHVDVAAEIILCGLNPVRLKEAQHIDATIPMLVLAAFIKLLGFSPKSFPNIYPLITATLHAYTIFGDLNDKSDLAGKILALQALADVAQMGNSAAAVKSTRAVVISLIGTATNHPSGLLRHAASEVRNAWFFVDE